MELFPAPENHIFLGVWTVEIGEWFAIGSPQHFSGQDPNDGAGY